MARDRKDVPIDRAELEVDGSLLARGRHIVACHRERGNSWTFMAQFEEVNDGAVDEVTRGARQLLAHWGEGCGHGLHVCSGEHITFHDSRKTGRRGVGCSCPRLSSAKRTVHSSDLSYPRTATNKQVIFVTGELCFDEPLEMHVLWCG